MRMTFLKIETLNTTLRFIGTNNESQDFEFSTQSNLEKFLARLKSAIWYAENDKRYITEIEEHAICTEDGDVVIDDLHISALSIAGKNLTLDRSEPTFLYAVSSTAEDISTGYVRLTEAEARLVAYVTNKNNWENAKLLPYDGYFTVIKTDG